MGEKVNKKLRRQGIENRHRSGGVRPHRKPRNAGIREAARANGVRQNAPSVAHYKLPYSSRRRLSPMSSQTHLAELVRRHEALEREISEAMSHPSADTVEITELKRRKLHLKDEIARLQRTETVH
jgi:hypothetical protein